MPTNLNALIRYKQIDACLRNRHRRWTIDDLRDACAEALGEHRGRYQEVSVRTLRDDIRVMRSEILGFNAPIEVEGGYYFYSDPEYSIFNTSISTLELLKKVFELLMEAKEKLNGHTFAEVLSEIAGITGQEVPGDVLEYIPKDTAGETEIRYKKKSDQSLETTYAYFRSRPEDDVLYMKTGKTNELFFWQKVLELL